MCCNLDELWVSKSRSICIYIEQLLSGWAEHLRWSDFSHFLPPTIYFSLENWLSKAGCILSLDPPLISLEPSWVKPLSPPKSPWAAVSSLQAIIVGGPFSALIPGLHTALGMHPCEQLLSFSYCISSLALIANTGLLEAASIPISSFFYYFVLEVPNTVAGWVFLRISLWRLS